MLPGRPVRHQLRVRAFKAGALCAVGNDLYVAEKVRLRVSAGGIVGGEFMIAGEVEEQSRFGRGRKAGTISTYD